MPAQRLCAASYLLRSFPMRSLLPHQRASQLLQNLRPQVQRNSRMRVRGDERRERVGEAGGNQFVQESARSPELRIEGHVVGVECVLRVGKEGNAGHNPATAGRFVEELPAEVGVYAVPLFTVGVADSLFDIAICQEQVRARLEAGLPGCLGLVDLIEVGHEGARLLYPQEEEVVARLRPDEGVQPLEFRADRGTEPRRGAEDPERTVNEEGQALHAIQPPEALEATQEVEG